MIFVADYASIRRGLVVDTGAKHFQRMRQSVWLYLYLLLAVNPRTGQRLIDIAAVAQDMGLREGTIRSWLGHLKKSGYVRVEHSGDHLRITVHRWRPPIARAASGAAAAPARRSRLPLTAEELADRLGADKRDPYFAALIASAPNGVLRETLDEVLDVPATQIRKSRDALFRYLIRQRLNR